MFTAGGDNLGGGHTADEGGGVLMATRRPTYSYQIDADDRITSVNADWLAFAAENNARNLDEQAVLGHLLWDFVSGDETVRLYKSVLARIRQMRCSVVLPFRCDSPTLERHMRMTILPEESAGIRFDCVIEKVRATDRFSLLDPAHPRLEEHLDMCSCCKRIDCPPQGWLEVSEVVGRLNLFDAPQVPALHQTVCQQCRQQAEAQ